MVFTWLEGLRKRIRLSAARRGGRLRAGRGRLGLEGLEDRTALSSFTWNVDADGSWTNPNNWMPTGFPNAVGASAFFGSVITADRTVTIRNPGVTVGSIQIDDNNRYLIARDGGTLTLENNSNAVIMVTVANGNGHQEIAVPIILKDTLDVTVAPTGQLTISGNISEMGGSFGLNKFGLGTLNLTGTNTYTGLTDVKEGNLTVTGSLTSDVTVRAGALPADAGAILQGTGQVQDVFVEGDPSLSSLAASSSFATLQQVSSRRGGTIIIGLSPGILHTHDVTMQAGAALEVELNGSVAGTGYDQLDVMGTVDLGDADLLVTLGFTPALGTRFTIIKNDGGESIMGIFNGLPEGSQVGNLPLQITYVGGDGNDVDLVAADFAAVIPEPSSLALVSAGLAGLLIGARRRRRRER
jgi:autotransporter-associated beta strand protein